MTEQVPIRLEKYTRREFRKALADGKFRVAILATGSIEQHLEHLAIELDTGQYPGHAQEFETSVALHMFPEHVRLDAIPPATILGLQWPRLAKGVNS